MADITAPSEWWAYLAAFDTLTDALARDDREVASSARRMMTIFHQDMIHPRPALPRKRQLRDEEYVENILDFLER